jgi:hypothetical protein
MSECKLNHTVEDVKKKYDSQKKFLPVELDFLFTGQAVNKLSQEQLNEVFHLLKKYDLATEEEQAARNQKLIKFIM